MSAPDEVQALLPRFAAIARDGIAAGLHPGLQVHVSLGGRVIASGVFGNASPDVPLTSDSVLPWLSAGKPLTAVAVLQQVEQGRLRLDDPVARRWPEFGQRGKEAVTIEHLLTHTAGIQPVPTGWPKRSWEQMLERICQAKLRHGWVPGEQAAYDPARSWIVLGEVLRRIDGRPIDELVREDVCEPAGLADVRMSLSPEDVQHYGSQLATLYEGEAGQMRPAPMHLALDAPPAPGGSVRGPARELARFYEMLLADGEIDGRRLLRPESVKLLVSRRRTGMTDLTFQHRIDFGLGVIVNSRTGDNEIVPYGFGRHASADAFGHGGSESSIGFADPACGLAAAIIATGRPGEAAHQRRNHALCSALYEDLGLV